ncbi:MAG: hypothetical protein FWG65_08650 [Turicibacter sp.]|nr:hypothetical protein [Turicibacter sp.]
MLITFEETSKMIEDGKLLHIAGTEALISKLPSGNWIGGSTEYFIAKESGKVSDDLLFVMEFPYENFQISNYSTDNIDTIADDVHEDGFSILILPFDSAIHQDYANNAAKRYGVFLKHIVGWISGTNIDKPEQTPIVVNGLTGEVHKDKAVALHFEIPDKMINVNIINIFEEEDNSPTLTFEETSFVVKECLVNGERTVLADYIAEHNIDIKLPLIGDYSGTKINISFRSSEDGVVNFYAPVSPNVKYKIAKKMDDYAETFNKRLANVADEESIFSCNCVLNFVYGGLEGKVIDIFEGPITFGEIAYLLVNQTLVYVTVQ